MDPYRWSWDADALVVLPGLAAAYLIATTRFPSTRWRTACFMAGCAVMLVTQIGPVDTLALHFLLTMHLLQNVAVAEWGPLLVVLGLTPAMARELERIPGARAVTHPLVALPVWLATYFAWHVPWAYDAALRHQWTILHAEHACYFAAGVLVWWPVSTAGGRAAAKTLYLFVAFVFASPLGLLLALLPEADLPLLRARSARVGPVAALGPAARRRDDGRRTGGRVLRRVRGLRAALPARGGEPRRLPRADRAAPPLGRVAVDQLDQPVALGAVSRDRAGQALLARGRQPKPEDAGVLLRLFR